jgi:hypothetical protein
MPKLFMIPGFLDLYRPVFKTNKISVEIFLREVNDFHACPPFQDYESRSPLKR